MLGWWPLHNGKIEGISEFATFFLQKTGPFHITRPHKSSETYWNFSQMTKVRIVHQVCLKFTSFSDFCQIFLLLMPCPFKHRLWEIFLYKMLDYLYSFESHIQYTLFFNRGLGIMRSPISFFQLFGWGGRATHTTINGKVAQDENHKNWHYWTFYVGFLSP